MSDLSDPDGPADVPNGDPPSNAETQIPCRDNSVGDASAPAPTADAEDDLTVDLNFLLPSANADALGRVGEYDVLSVEGCGGMGIVLKAFDHGLHRTVAVKVPAPELASSRRFRARFLREARAVAAISHPNVVTIHAVGEHNGLPYLVMEYISGRTLRQRMAQAPPFQVADILRIGAQVAEGLEAAHRRGVIHRDVKPSNIMLENGIERVKITDFGLARAALDQSGLTSVGRLVGTPAFMAPEQLREGKADVRSDLFGLGCVMYAMVAGRSPFQGSHTLEIIHKVSDVVPPPLHEIQPGLPMVLSTIVSRLLEKDPDQRYQSAAEVAADLTQLLALVHQDASGARLVDKLSVRPAPAHATETTRARRTRKPAALAAGLAVLAIVASTPLWFPPGGGRPDDVETSGIGRASSVPSAPTRTASPAGTPAGPAAETPPVDAVIDERSADRRAAEWVLGLGGTVDLLLGNVVETLDAADALPEREFALISIDLTANERAAGGLQNLAGLSQLRSLKLYGVRVTDADLEHVGRLDALVHLDLYHAQITDAGLEHIAGLTRLESLSIHHTQVSDAGLAELAGLRELQALNLAATDVSDEGLAHLEPMVELRWLQLSRTRVTDAGLEHLKGFKELSELYLSDLSLSDDAVASLQAALPACSITTE
ncbi:MAG TPA: protein kinase [Planctomycetaceae bacterium]|nr:protein kinase [Planctomycetaceae bacterium]